MSVRAVICFRPALVSFSCSYTLTHPFHLDFPPSSWPSRVHVTLLYKKPRKKNSSPANSEHGANSPNIFDPSGGDADGHRRRRGRRGGSDGSPNGSGASYTGPLSYSFHGGESPTRMSSFESGYSAGSRASSVERGDNSPRWRGARQRAITATSALRSPVSSGRSSPMPFDGSWQHMGGPVMGGPAGPMPSSNPQQHRPRSYTANEMRWMSAPASGYVGPGPGPGHDRPRVSPTYPSPLARTTLVANDDSSLPPSPGGNNGFNYSQAGNNGLNYSPGAPIVGGGSQMFFPPSRGGGMSALSARSSGAPPMNGPRNNQGYAQDVHSSHLFSQFCATTTTLAGTVDAGDVMDEDAFGSGAATPPTPTAGLTYSLSHLTALGTSPRVDFATPPGMASSPSSSAYNSPLNSPRIGRRWREAAASNYVQVSGVAGWGSAAGSSSPLMGQYMSTVPGPSSGTSSPRRAASPMHIRIESPMRMASPSVGSASPTRHTDSPARRETGLLNEENIVRQPSGPDGTRGFYTGWRQRHTPPGLDDKPQPPATAVRVKTSPRRE